MRQGTLQCQLAASAPVGQSAHLNFCPFLQRHFCVLAVCFPSREALHTVYGTILEQHLARQTIPPLLRKMQPQLVAAALGEPLPHWGGTSLWGMSVWEPSQAQGTLGTWSLLTPLSCQQPCTRRLPPTFCQQPSSSTTFSTCGTSPTYSR